jgi:hypothetical protein
MGKRARCLARAGRGVDPVLFEKGLGDARHFRRKRIIGGQHDVAGLVPGHGRGLCFRQRRIAIPGIHLLHAEPSGLHGVIAVRQARIGGLDGCRQRIDHRTLDTVGQMPAVGDIGKSAPFVGNVLVLGERIGDQREDADIVLEHLADRFGGGAAQIGRRLLQFVERFFERDVPAGKRNAQAGDRFVEQTVPGRSAGLGFFEEQLFELLVELERLFEPEIINPGAIAQRRGVILVAGLDRLVGDEIEFQPEKQQMPGHIGNARADIGEEFAIGGIGHVAVIGQARIGADAADQIFERFKADDGGAETVSTGFQRGVGKLALPAIFKRSGLVFGLFHVSKEVHAIGGGVKIAEIPLGQIAQLCGGATFDHGRFLHGKACATHVRHQLHRGFPYDFHVLPV